MRILVLTSCTGKKAVAHEQALTWADFQQGSEHLAARESELADLLTPAEELYTGQQHLRLLRGVRALRAARPVNGEAVPTLELYILSAGYGIVPASRKLVPYECSFVGMGSRRVRTWADTLEVPQSLRRLLSQEYDLALVLLGDSYLKACRLDEDLRPGGPVLLFCSTAATKQNQAMDRLRWIPLSKQDARKFRCGFVGLKGEIAARLLELIAQEHHALATLTNPATDILALLDRPPRPERKTREQIRVNPDVDQVISIPDAWWHRPQKGQLSYFIPEWDDLVDPEYDFIKDEHSCGRGHWSNNVYAHQLYPEPSYDGILVSKLVAENNKEKKERINSLGVHRFFRLPDAFPIMGDCGAFGYIKEDVPPYHTNEILDYYTRLGFNYGVSIDHLIVTSTDAQRRHRYELTIQNAEDFLKEHRRRGLLWEPIGAVQGWDAASYAQAARKYVKMGYRYIALGGLVRSPTAEILRIVETVHNGLPEGMRLHLFGLARFKAIRQFVRLGVTSIDSASVLRRAWLGAHGNFLTASGWYPAIRVPQSDRCFRAKRLIEDAARTVLELQKLEAECLASLREYGARQRVLSRGMLDRLVEYDTLVAGPRKGTRERIRRTLGDRPWEACGCAICARWGIEIAIFRGNNRNRRRGFHNTHVFYRLIGRILNGERFDWIDEDQTERDDQPSLFS